MSLTEVQEGLHHPFVRELWLKITKTMEEYEKNKSMCM